MRLVLVEQKVGDVKVVWYFNLSLEFKSVIARQAKSLVKVIWNENETGGNHQVILPSLVD